MLLSSRAVAGVSYSPTSNTSAAWREENRDWIDIAGDRHGTIRLTPMRQANKRDYMNDNSSAIFYCLASDLFRAYDDFGYQIFEPNVRANIKNSKVNSAIEESASHKTLG